MMQNVGRPGEVSNSDEVIGPFDWLIGHSCPGTVLFSCNGPELDLILLC